MVDVVTYPNPQCGTSRNTLALVRSARVEPTIVVADVFEYPLSKSPAANFNLVICASCGEAVAENKARIKDGKPICLPCGGYSS